MFIDVFSIFKLLVIAKLYHEYDVDSSYLASNEAIDASINWYFVIKESIFL